MLSDKIANDVVKQNVCKFFSMKKFSKLFNSFYNFSLHESSQSLYKSRSKGVTLLPSAILNIYGVL